jgi:hypothetical protein
VLCSIITNYIVEQNPEMGKMQVNCDDLPIKELGLGPSLVRRHEG